MSFAAMIAALTLLTIPATLLAKGNTVKILITAPDTTNSFESMDPQVRQFNVWDGPGTFRNGVEAKDGFIVDWEKGPVAERPSGLRRFEVSFYAGCRTDEWGCRFTQHLLAYVVSYEYHPATGTGYVFIPGRTDPGYPANSKSLLRPGWDGKWYIANEAWRRFVDGRLP